ncbi:C45 family autoproteolytic acyltransferase/hydolase [Chitinophaga pinensis]|uniref:Peptidase C45 acyl-coenzyme A:6-aminopenicillanic acid acyl-transferase n=1 Tax=Chitinophaga pinensis (strain ATCC 43595 / DSM 2588 / LMG 13176 / NBRC 15968 / NCIMB 11800 / UQM 2034) TaxID=485918 RepID=A0A979G2B3_CHIPD|nr:C45 family peptidase [Chitinophaga pinensis]ACU59371.1 peptidase C45 acyl-coenzyme A:6- aminopenicillanic acid acyl-transferase [Chitinophaga pinensis DSM 2588]
MALKRGKKRNGWRKLGRALLYITGTILLLIIILVVYVMSVSHIDPPEIADKSSLQWERKALDSSSYTLGNSWFRKSESGLYELYVEGKPFERGVVEGRLTAELVKRQEDHFTDQIKKMIPSQSYLKFLRYFVGFFNRNLADNIAEENKEEIYGISFSASDKYDFIGSNYERLLNYHAAHDIGHALQNMALVACTSFGTWDGASADSNLIIGRNFDFYVGDKFAEDKIVAFYHPEKGYRFMMVTWGGFTGVTSGMNEKGLTVTINADKSDIPTGSATPVSLVAREILQYAKTIDEAWTIANKHKMFVSESFLVGSAEDNRAAIIEKTPEKMDMYDPKDQFITCTNHFQGAGLAKEEKNIKQREETASGYRFNRLSQLLKEKGPNTVQKTVDILRDRAGMGGRNIGMGNERAINQFIAHHSIVFEPKKKMVWVSTAPWQLGKFVAYNLDSIFSMKGLQYDHEVYDSTQTIAADPFLQTQDYQSFVAFRKIKTDIMDGKDADVQQLISLNPEYYHAYVLAGDYMFKRKDYTAATAYYKKALTKVIATRGEEKHIRKQLEKCAKSK